MELRSLIMQRLPRLPYPLFSRTQGTKTPVNALRKRNLLLRCQGHHISEQFKDYSSYGLIPNTNVEVTCEILVVELMKERYTLGLRVVDDIPVVVRLRIALEKKAPEKSKFKRQMFVRVTDGEGGIRVRLCCRRRWIRRHTRRGPCERGRMEKIPITKILYMGYLALESMRRSSCARCTLLSLRSFAEARAMFSKRLFEANSRYDFLH
jgi:hypothetical protein